MCDREPDEGLTDTLPYDPNADDSIEDTLPKHDSHATDASLNSTAPYDPESSITELHGQDQVDTEHQHPGSDSTGSATEAAANVNASLQSGSDHTGNQSSLSLQDHDPECSYESKGSHPPYPYGFGDMTKNSQEDVVFETVKRPYAEAAATGDVSQLSTDWKQHLHAQAYERNAKRDGFEDIDKTDAQRHGVPGEWHEDAKNGSRARRETIRCQAGGIRKFPSDMVHFHEPNRKRQKLPGKRRNSDISDKSIDQMMRDESDRFDTTHLNNAITEIDKVVEYRKYASLSTLSSFSVPTQAGDLSREHDSSHHSLEETPDHAGDSSGNTDQLKRQGSDESYKSGSRNPYRSPSDRTHWRTPPSHEFPSPDAHSTPNPKDAAKRQPQQPQQQDDDDVQEQLDVIPSSSSFEDTRPLIDDDNDGGWPTTEHAEETETPSQRQPPARHGSRKRNRDLFVVCSTSLKEENDARLAWERMFIKGIDRSDPMKNRSIEIPLQFDQVKQWFDLMMKACAAIVSDHSDGQVVGSGKYLCARLAGKPVISGEWLRECVKNEDIIAIEPYIRRPPLQDHILHGKDIFFATKSKTPHIQQAIAIAANGKRLTKEPRKADSNTVVIIDAGDESAERFRKLGLRTMTKDELNASLV